MAEPLDKTPVPLNWTETDAAFLQPLTLPLVHHAWERQPLSPFDRDFRTRKVWKRYDAKPLQQQPQRKQNCGEADISLFTTLGGRVGCLGESDGLIHVVKRLCLEHQARINRDGEFSRTFVGTRWDRGAGALLRKERTHVIDEVSTNNEPVEEPESPPVALNEACPPPPLPSIIVAEETQDPHLEADTAILRDFLNRAAASKATKRESIARRASLSHRRDSGAVRQALASPRKALEEKDPNSPSIHIVSESAPEEREFSSGGSNAHQDGTENDTCSAKPLLEKPSGAAKENAHSKPASRRSTRSRSRSRASSPATPHPSASNAPTPHKIPVRRTDGTDSVILQKTDAQEVALLTRNNTRKNRAGSVMVPARLLKLSVEAAKNPEHVEEIVDRVLQDGEKGVRWDTQLVYFFRTSDTIATAPAPEPCLPLTVTTPSSKRKDSVARAIRSSPPPSVAVTVSDKVSPQESEVPEQRNPLPTSKLPQTPRLRRLRGLGAANGTPGKGLLPPASATEGLAARVAPDEQREAITSRKIKIQVKGVETKKGNEPTHVGKLQVSEAPRSLAIGAGEGLRGGLARRGARRRGSSRV